MTTEREIRIKRLLYQSWYRGCKETDKILGYFAKEHLHSFDDAQLDAFEKIMQEDDKNLFNWITGTEAIPEEYANDPMFNAVLTFDVPAALDGVASE